MTMPLVNIFRMVVKSENFYDGHDAHEAFGKYFHFVNSTSVPIHLPRPPMMATLIILTMQRLRQFQ